MPSNRHLNGGLRRRKRDSQSAVFCPLRRRLQCHDPLQRAWDSLLTLNFAPSAGVLSLPCGLYLFS